MAGKVLLGMSGGIDSSVAAISLLKDGYVVTGVTFLFSGGPGDSNKSAGEAKELAHAIGIEHYTIDLRNAFDELVVGYFKNSYLNGRTPFPCAVCNPQLKFSQLVKIANQLDCAYISTGHYVQITGNQNVKFVKEGVDPEKDQSFFLWGLKREVINRLIFPLGKLYKEEVRQIAAKHSFQYLTEKKESIGICFINGGNYRQYLSESGIHASPGNFIDTEGNVLGEHKGIVYYTVGQRKGLNLQVNKPLFVTEIRPDTNEIVLGDYQEMYRSRIFLQDIHFVDAGQMDSNRIYRVRIRYRMQENACRVMFHDEQSAVIELLEPVAMVTPGQTAVIYEDGRVLGGGFIARSE